MSRYRWLSIGIVTLAVALGVFYSQTRPVSYVSSASLVIEDPRAGSVFNSLVGVSPFRYLADQVVVLSSTSVAERAALLVADSSPDAQVTIDDFLEGTVIEASDVNNSIEISFYAQTPQQAEVGANAIADAYQDVRRSESIRSAASALEQLDAKILDIETELLDVSSRIIERRSSAASGLGLGEEFDTAVQRLAVLLADQNAGNFSDEDRQELEDTIRHFQTIQVIGGIEAQDPEASALLRQQSALIDRQSELKSRRDGIEVDAELASAGVSHFSPARGATTAGFGLGRTLGISLVLGLLAAAALAYALALRHRGFSDRWQPEPVVKAPLLAEVSDFKTEGVKSQLPVRDVPLSAAAEAFRFGITSIELRMAASAVGPTAAAKSLVVVSPGVGDGKTTVAANLALAAARRGNRVLAVDADFGDQQLFQLLSGEANPLRPGLTDVVEKGIALASSVTAVRQDGSDIQLIGRGLVDVSAPEFFRSSGAELFFEAVRSEYDLIVVDTPPILQVAYASLIARLADMALVVVRHGGNMNSLADLRDRIDLVGTSIAGYLYNRAPLRPEMVESEGSMKDVLGRPSTRSGSASLRGES